MSSTRIRTLVQQQWAGLIALFLVLTGGTAYALEGSNTVFTDDIVNGQVRAPDIGDGEVMTAEIANGQVKATDIADGEVRSAEIANGQVMAADLGDGEVQAAEIAAGGVRTAEIQNGQVQAEDLAANVVPGASGARAYGTVTAAGDLSRSKGVTDVTPSGGGGLGNFYCIDLASHINPATATLVVGPDYTGSGTDTINYNFPIVMAKTTNFNCPSGELEVVTFLFHGEGYDDANDRDYLIANPQPFTFVVP